MAVLTVRNVPDEVHRALRVRAAEHGRSAEAEVREILSAALVPSQRLLLGDALASLRPHPALPDDDRAAPPRPPTTPGPRWTRYATGPRRSRRRCRDRPGHQRRLRGDAAQAESRRADLAKRPSRRHPLPVERVARGTAVRYRGPARRSEEEPAGAGARPAARAVPRSGAP